MANPSGEKNIGPWEGQQVEYIPLDDLVLWTENPRDPLDGDYTNDDVIRRATYGRNDKQWQLSKLSKEMGDRFDLSELPTVCRIDDGPKYRVYDGNRRVILAMLRKAGLTTEGQQQLVPPDFPDPIPCNVCDEETALENVERKHRGNGSWKQYERDRFMFDYRGGPKTVLIRLEELIKAVTKWPALNMRYVEDDVFNKKHLEEMGLLPDEPDFGVPLELLEELVEAVADKLDNELNTRNARNDPASVLPGELMDRIREARHRRPAGEKADGRERELPSDNSEPPSQSHGGLGRDDVLRPDTSGTLPHTDASARRRRGRTRQVKPASIPVFGNPSGLRLQTGDVNNMYRTLEELWNMYARGGMRNAAAFVPIFRMGLRLLIDTAALAAALFSVGYRPHPLDALRRPGKPMRWFLCLGCVLVLPIVTFYASALLVSLIPDTSENTGIAATDTFGEYVVMFIQIMGEACLSILLFALLYKALNRAWGRSDPWVRPLVAWLVSAFLFGMPHLPTHRWNFLQCLVIFFSLFLGFAAFVATRSWTILFLSHFLYDLLSRPLVLNACRHAALLWLLVAVACVYWHFGKGSASRPASPPAPPISADCRVDGMPRSAGSPAVA